MWRAFDKSAGNDSLDYQLLAAELALDAKDYAGATAAADRALALNPSSVSALVLKGRSLSENKAGDAARFVQARALFTRAHKIDGDDPSPLIGFYDAWRRQGGAMPKEATFALEDAFPLAAHDYSYRMMLTRMLLEQGRFPQAEQVIAPLAYSYDGRDPAKYTPLVVVNKLKSGDTAGALTSINEAFAKAEKDDK
jgi:Flp pilus assembly protein TadD